MKSFVNLFFLLFILGLTEIHGKPSSVKDPFDQIEMITTEQIETLLRQELETQISGEFQFKLNRHPFPLEVIAEEPVNTEIHDLEINSQKTRFTAKVIFKGFDAPPLALSGTIIPMTQVPALSCQLSPSETIQEQDIIWISVPSRSVNRSLITSPELLIGAQPRNSVLRADTPLRVNDIKRAKAIQRGALVTVGLSNGVMSIEMQAKALEEGDIGSIIKLINLTSNRVIQGHVKNVNYVEILSTSSQITKEIP